MLMKCRIIMQGYSFLSFREIAVMTDKGGQKVRHKLFSPFINNLAYLAQLYVEHFQKPFVKDPGFFDSFQHGVALQQNSVVLYQRIEILVVGLGNDIVDKFATFFTSFSDNAGVTRRDND